jgi:hypothetical protein
MSNMTEHLGILPSRQKLELLDTKTPIADETLFRQLFQSVTFEKPDHRRGVPSEDSPTVAVGNPTPTCQQDGASSDTTDSDDAHQTVGIGDSEQRSDEEEEDRKDNKNEELIGAFSTFTPQGDRRIFTDFEAAGLPRKEIIRLAHALHESVLAGRQTVSLGLRVPLLGELRFDVRIAGNVVFIHAFVENEQASAALALAISTLREKLEERQLILGRLDVTTKRRNRYAREDVDRDADASGKRRRAKRDLLLPSLGRLDAEEKGGSLGNCER